MLTIAVNGHALATDAIVRRGRALLPMRATFSALGARVDYEPRGRIVVARSQDHDVVLRIGSTKAYVDAGPVHLDVAPQIVASSTFVPLRFVAQALGARVDYDSARSRVNVTLAPAFAAAATSQVSAQAPSPSTSVPTAYPNISATIAAARANQGDIVLTVDGLNVTPLSSFDGATITYLPRTALAPGPHTVNFSGKTTAGALFSSTWTFTTASTPPAEQNIPMQDYGYRFYTSGPGWYHYGDWMHFTLLAPPGGSAYLRLCNLGYRYNMWNGGNDTYYRADFPAPYGFWIPSCQVSAVYTAWNGSQYEVPYPVFVGLYTLPQPLVRPTPSPHPVPLPSDRRRPEPTATPRPTPTPALKPTPKPVLKPSPKPVVKPSPKPVILPSLKPVLRPEFKPLLLQSPKPLAKQTPKPVPKPTRV